MELQSSIVSSSGKTRFQAALERAREGGGPCLGQWMMFPGYTLAQCVASLGFDWVAVDCEHGNIDDAQMYHSVAAVAATGASPMVRIPIGEPWMVKRALDCGAHALMVPMVETKEQAETVALAAKYPSSAWPRGFRGVGTQFAFHAFHQDRDGYYTKANENITVIVQIETVRGLENCEEIAKVDGIDMLFIGPNDLCSSMGHFAPDHEKIPEVQEATQRVLRAAKAAGKYAGHFALSAEIAAQRYKEGFECVNCGGDVVALSAWMGTEKARLSSLLSK